MQFFQQENRLERHDQAIGKSSQEDHRQQEFEYPALERVLENQEQNQWGRYVNG